MVLKSVPDPESVDLNGEFMEEEKSSKKIPLMDLLGAFAKVINGESMPRHWAPFPHRFHVLKEGNGEHRYIQETGNKTLKDISRQVIVDSLTTYIKEDCYHIQSFISQTRLFKDIVDFWASTTPPFPHYIAPVRTLSGEGYTWHRLSFDFEPGPHPVWGELLARMTNSQAFMAFVGSLFIPESYNQQYIWCYGNGGEGKGSAMRFLGKVFQQASVSLRAPEPGTERFFASELIGKRLGMFDDIDSPNFPSSGLFKSLTGGDMVRIEAKRKNAFSVKLHCKYIFTSNNKPNLTAKKADTRRIIYCGIGPTEKDWGPYYEELLWKEAQYFLHACLEEYYRQCPDHKHIPTEVSQLAELISTSEEHFEAIWQKYFIPKTYSELTPAKDRPYVSLPRMYDILLFERLFEDKAKRRFLDWAESTHCVKKQQVRLDKGSREWRYVGIGEKAIQM